MRQVLQFFDAHPPSSNRNYFGARINRRPGTSDVPASFNCPHNLNPGRRPSRAEPPVEFDPPQYAIAMATSQLRAIGVLARTARLSQRAFSTSARQLEAAAAVTPPKPSTESPTAATTAVEDVQAIVGKQAPNRVGVWSKSQKPRAVAMTGPRFEQTDFSVQV